MATNSTLEAFRSVAYALRDRYLPYHEGHLIWQTGKTGNDLMSTEYYLHLLHVHIKNLFIFLDYNLELPPWLCQPYVREPPQEYTQKIQVDESSTINCVYC